MGQALLQRCLLKKCTEKFLSCSCGPERKKIKMSDNIATSNYIELAADIVSAYVSNNSVPLSDLPSLINEVHGALMRVGGGTVEAPVEAPKPAVAVKKSVTPDYIVCLEDGKKFKSLKRHLRTQYNMTPEQYREKWALPVDYPMVAPNYAKARSELAKEMGLGQQRRKAPARRSRG
jgi:predicted transcriptional regulator